ncbi:hypothetical protein BHYA_0291g00050 [Botrytis hyacinthi]|uniref:Uncharacterized protein n=1 Tax=Botrytis hyacinthi TaxID=278943 RepID=A0A4Z1GCD4_9HELO|nr:hypothetical protein BHYA_0291g00050 [Botrytis hyacinthi]
MASPRYSTVASKVLDSSVASGTGTAGTIATVVPTCVGQIIGILPFFFQDAKLGKNLVTSKLGERGGT